MEAFNTWYTGTAYFWNWQIKEKVSILKQMCLSLFVHKKRKEKKTPTHKFTLKKENTEWRNSLHKAMSTYIKFITFLLIYLTFYLNIMRSKNSIIKNSYSYSSTPLTWGSVQRSMEKTKTNLTLSQSTVDMACKLTFFKDFPIFLILGSKIRIMPPVSSFLNVCCHSEKW